MQDAPPQEVTIVGDDWEELPEKTTGGGEHQNFVHLIPCLLAEWQDVDSFEGL